MRDTLTKTSLLALMGLAASLVSTSAALALDEVTYGTNWLAQAEHGGFYQAVADGTYEKYGLKVTVIQGGPQAANRALLIAGKVDFYMGSPLGEMDAVKEGIPLIDVAAIFQKDPQVLLAHPDQGIETFADLAKLDSIFMGKDGYVTYYEWMKKNFEGFTDEKYKPYTFNPAPFIADPKSAQQGYLTSEPYEIEKQAGWAPKVFLLADNGYNPYSTMITTTTTMVESKPDVVQRFVDASIEGWYNYLYGDNKAANDLIKKHNPDQTDDRIAYALKVLNERGIVMSGDALKDGIGAMSAARWKGFYDQMADVDVLPKGLDFAKAYTLEFVNKGIGR